MNRPLPVLSGLAALLAAATISLPASAQSRPTDYRDEITRHFEASIAKVIRLAHAMPDSLYGWSPMEGTMPVGQVYAHIARYNYLYFSRELGLPLPDHVDMSTMEETRDKTVITRMLEESTEYVRMHIADMREEDLARMTTQYRREVPGWAVLLQLVAHMNEHVGQSVAYARMNGIVPPWSM